MQNESIIVHGARVHNLKNVSVTIPRDKITVITGLSGSGKSSLAFDTIYAEGQRRYIESLSLHARQYIEQLEKPDLDSIEGLSPAIAIEQKTSSQSSKSTVGTVTEIYDYLRLLYTRVGTPRCPTHDEPIRAQTIELIDSKLSEHSAEAKLFIYAIFAHGEKGTFEKEFDQLRKKGFSRARIDGVEQSLSEVTRLAKNVQHDIEIAIDRFKKAPSNRSRLLEALRSADDLGKGRILVKVEDEGKSVDRFFNTKAGCPICFYSFPPLAPRLFSFNSPYGMCLKCSGRGSEDVFDSDLLLPQVDESLWDYLGDLADQLPPFFDKSIRGIFKAFKVPLNEKLSHFSKKFREGLITGVEDCPSLIALFDRWFNEGTQDEQNLLESLRVSRKCPECRGSRIRLEGRSVTVQDQRIYEVTGRSVSDLIPYLKGWEFEGNQKLISDKILSEAIQRLEFLFDVGLGYLTLDRTTSTLSGGEAQRVRLASQLGTDLSGVLYILDEPSIGLHPRDHHRLLGALKTLRDQGNTVVIVEHDEETIRTADHLVDVGPAAGRQGGKLLFSGTPQELTLSDTLTHQYLSKQLSAVTSGLRTFQKEHAMIKLSGATGNNLKQAEIAIPHQSFTVVTGVSGSGKSSLILETLYPSLKKATTKRPTYSLPYTNLSGVEPIGKVMKIDQKPIGRTPRSNPATYSGVFSLIRSFFAQVPEANARGYGPSRFSFNVGSGRCERCEGDGVIRLEMHFMPDVFVTCEQCHGRRYNRETCEVLYRGKSIADVLEMTIDDANAFFENHPLIQHKLQTLLDVGLGYLSLGQGSPSLSGGEAQRLKLARELSKISRTPTLYILDEPTTGLHFHDVKRLLECLQSLVNHGHTVVVIEHQMDVIASADWIIDLGPEGGSGGGEVLFSGPYKKFRAIKNSPTASWMAESYDLPHIGSKRTTNRPGINRE